MCPKRWEEEGSQELCDAKAAYIKLQEDYWRKMVSRGLDVSVAVRRHHHGRGLTCLCLGLNQQKRAVKREREVAGRTRHMALCTLQLPPPAVQWGSTAAEKRYAHPVIEAAADCVELLTERVPM